MAFEGINWGLAQPVDVGGALLAGVQHGQAMRREADTQNALGAYAANPSMQTANALIGVDPRIGMQARTQQLALDKQTQERAAIVAATGGGGEHRSVGALVKMGVPYEMARQINDDHVDALGKSADFLGQVGLRVTAASEAERPQIWAQAVQQAHALGMDVPPEFAQYSPAALDGVLAASKQMKEAIGMTAPEYIATQPGGGVFNKNPLSPGFDPTAAQGGAAAPAAVDDKAAYDALPPGSSYIAPDGSHRVKGGAPSQGGATFPLG
jgi:hypothetical protein